MTNHIYLAHHGIKGMKWGVRRFQNADGTLTSAGKKRYDKQQKRQMKKDIKAAKRAWRKDSGEWMTTGRHVSEVDKKVSRELSSNKRREELGNEIDRLNGVISKFEQKRDAENEKVNIYDDLLSDENINDVIRRNYNVEQERAKENAQRYQDNLDIAQTMYDEVRNEYRSIGERVANAHFEEYKRAVVADLGYDDIETGVKKLEEYGLVNNALRWNSYRWDGV